MDKLSQIVLLSLGGVLGVNARYWFGLWVSRYAGSQFPWATFFINVSGSFLIGFFTMVLTRWLPHHHMRLLVITGFLGGYTTYSSFALESVMLWERGEKSLSLAYVAATVIVGFLAVLLGMALGSNLTNPQNDRAARAKSQTQIASGDEPLIPGEWR